MVIWALDKKLMPCNTFLIIFTSLFFLLAVLITTPCSTRQRHHLFTISPRIIGDQLHFTDGRKKSASLTVTVQKDQQTQYLWNWELTFPWAVIGIKGFRGNNPLAPANVSKIHLEIASGTIPWLIPLLPPRLLQGLLIKLESLALLVVVLPLLFLTLCPLGQSRLESFVRFSVFPPLILIVLVLGSWKLVVLQWQQDVGGAFSPPLSKAAPHVIFWPREDPCQRIVVPLQTGNNVFWLWNGRVIGIYQNVGLIVKWCPPPQVTAGWIHFDTNQKFIALFCFVQDLSDIFPLPGKDIAVRAGDVY